VREAVAVAPVAPAIDPSTLEANRERDIPKQANVADDPVTQEYVPPNLIAPAPPLTPAKAKSNTLLIMGGLVVAGLGIYLLKRAS
jgi:hypothetical protein